jgi:hypothetical protein
MTPGPDAVFACPHCSAVARLATIEEADTSGAVSWTDGYQECPGIPRHPNVLRCQGCKKFYWLGEARQLGWYALGIELPPELAGWATAPMMEPLDEAGYHEALASGMAQNPERELELRVHAWWRGNDRFRQSGGTAAPARDERQIANMERMIELCAQGDHEILLFRAEALRELGRFDEASEALYGLCSDYAAARERIAALVQAQSRDLAVLFAQGGADSQAAG